ncbi:MAG: hypothetical protein NC218_02245 [Acetobacter sp.]|nr:hypothetical protein [Acetobacter sp.]
MLEVRGFTIKNVRHPEGREGYGLLCDIFYKGKKVGSCEDYGMGSVSNVYIDAEYKELFQQAQDAFYAQFPQLANDRYDDDTFVTHLDALKEDLRVYKQKAKLGYPCLVRVAYQDWSENYCWAKTRAAIDNYVKTKTSVDKVFIYTSENDFKVA